MVFGEHMDIAHVVIEATLVDLQFQFPHLVFYMEEPTSTTLDTPGIVIYTNTKRNDQEYRNLLYYYLHEEAYIGISITRNFSTYDTSYHYVYHSILTPQSLDQLKQYLHNHLKSL